MMGWFNKSATHCVVTLLMAGSCLVAPRASADAINGNLLKQIPNNEVFEGIASFYDDPGLTSSGEQYDPKRFTAAVQIDIRNQFGGVRYGRLYQPVYAIAEYAGKRAIVKLNDVGPLRPGRKFDLSRAAMEHFGGLEVGLLPDFKMTLLPRGRDYTLGPVNDEVTVAEVRDLYKAQARLLAPIDPVETAVARNEHVDEFDAVAALPAADDSILTGSTDKTAETPASNVETDAPVMADTAVTQPVAAGDVIAFRWPTASMAVAAIADGTITGEGYAQTIADAVATQTVTADDITSSTARAIEAATTGQADTAIEAEAPKAAETAEPTDELSVFNNIGAL